MSNVRMTQVTALVLQAVATGHRYGFDVMDASGLASGTVYPALRRLEEAGLLAGLWEAQDDARRDGRPPRKLYELTPAGREALAAAASRLAEARALFLSLPDGPETVS